MQEKIGYVLYNENVSTWIVSKSRPLRPQNSRNIENRVCLKLRIIKNGFYIKWIFRPTLLVNEAEGPDKGKLFISRVGSVDYSKYHVVDMLKASFMMTDILLQEDDNYVIGGQVIELYKNVSDVVGTDSRCQYYFF